MRWWQALGELDGVGVGLGHRLGDDGAAIGEAQHHQYAGQRGGVDCLELVRHSLSHSVQRDGRCHGWLVPDEHRARPVRVDRSTRGNPVDTIELVTLRAVTIRVRAGGYLVLDEFL